MKGVRTCERGAGVALQTVLIGSGAFGSRASSFLLVWTVQSLISEASIKDL